MAFFKDPLTNGSGVRPITEHIAPSLEFHQCPHCRKCFYSGRKLAAHAFIVHNELSPIRRKVFGSQCWACLLLFDNYPCLAAHARKRKSCQQWYLDHVDDMSPECLEEVLTVDRAMRKDNTNKGRSSVHAASMVVLLAGPLPKGAPQRKSFNRRFDYKE